MALTQEDALAIVSSAKGLGVDPRTLGALFELESGTDPNIWGGAGGQYRGLIQFGPGARKEVGLPSGPMTIAGQLPYVEKYFRQRGFQPGKHGPTELYRTVLVGNPGQSGTDSFGTNSDTAATRMMPGGDLYKRFSEKLDSALGGDAAGILRESGPVGLGASSAQATRAVGPLVATASAMINQGLSSAPGQTRMAMGLEAQRAAIEALTGAGAIAPEAAEIATLPPAAAGGTGSPAGDLKVIEYLTGDPGHSGYREDHSGGNYHEHLAFKTKEQRDAAMRKLQLAGIQIGSVNDGKHSPGSYHYQDLAFDVPAAQVARGKERELSRRVRAVLGIR